MTNLPHPHLDLAGTIRPGLDILANEIVIALKKRTRFSINEPVYKSGLVVSDPEVSLLDHVLGRLNTVTQNWGAIHLQRRMRSPLFIT